MTNEETLHRARLAAEVLDNPLVVEALAMMRASVVDKWESSLPWEKESRETLYFQQLAIEQFEAIFRKLIEDGKFAEHSIKRAEQG
jgi:hypothetical protein